MKELEDFLGNLFLLVGFIVVIYICYRQIMSY